MLTAAVRDLHLSQPGLFQTDVRTACPDLWDNNPYITPLQETDPEVEIIECEYPLINEANELPYHCLHGFRKFLAEKLGVKIKPFAFKGDIHISAAEKSWFSQVYERTESKLPFWIIAAGGKFDITVKWWSQERYQAVVDYFKDKLLFVQIGETGHHHPRLNGVLDLRGQTTLRELVRLVYHSQGVLSSVTAVMHLAAAVPTKDGGLRPCVVVAGAREPAHWEAYPGHQFIHTNGSVSCGGTGGCWRDRVAPLGDQTERDLPDRLCLEVIKGLPRCLHIIKPREVVRRIETYFLGGAHRYLTEDELEIKRRIGTQQQNDYDILPLTPSKARIALQNFIKNFRGTSEAYTGRGIVICAGGDKYLPCAWVCVRMLRFLGCSLPIEIWHLEGEVNDKWVDFFSEWDVCFVNGTEVQKAHPMRILNGWELKSFAIMHSKLAEVIFLDADNVPTADPTSLFSSEEYLQTGTLFWPDYDQYPRTHQVYSMLGLKMPSGPELESGQMVVDKRRCLKGLAATVWINSHSDFFYQYLHGDKETFRIGWKAAKCSYRLIPWPIKSLEGTMCQHAPDGTRMFQHRNTLKWILDQSNRRVDGFLFEEECLGFLEELKNKWTKVSPLLQNPDKAPETLSAA